SVRAYAERDADPRTRIDVLLAGSRRTDRRRRGKLLDDVRRGIDPEERPAGRGRVALSRAQDERVAAVERLEIHVVGHDRSRHATVAGVDDEHLGWSGLIGPADDREAVTVSGPDRLV